VTEDSKGAAPSVEPLDELFSGAHEELRRSASLRMSTSHMSGIATAILMQRTRSPQPGELCGEVLDTAEQRTRTLHNRAHLV
jgi:hypothetical protein